VILSVSDFKVSVDICEGRQHSLIWGIKPGFTWRECRKPRKISAMIARLGAKIWTRLLLNMTQYWFPGCHI